MIATDTVRDGWTTLIVEPGRSSIRIEARSSAGPIEFSSDEITGEVLVRIEDGGVDVSDPPTAAVSLPVTTLTSGNALYDAEVQQRLHARRYPLIRAELNAATPLAAGRFVLDGVLTIHGVSRALNGTVQVTMTDHPRLFVEGEQLVDMRDFGIPLPNALMLRIYPDVLVRFRLEAVKDKEPAG